MWIIFRLVFEQGFQLVPEDGGGDRHLEKCRLDRFPLFGFRLGQVRDHSTRGDDHRRRIIRSGQYSERVFDIVLFNLTKGESLAELSQSECLDIPRQGSIQIVLDPLKTDIITE